MTLQLTAVAGRGLVAPGEPVFRADDEALLRGMAAFETLRVYGGRPFLLDRHLGRLRFSCAALGLGPPAGIGELAAEVVAAAPPDHVLRLYRSSATVAATAATVPEGLEAERGRGLTLLSVAAAAGPLTAGVKATSYAPALAARAAARAGGADDALLVADGAVREAATANVWWRCGGDLATPPAGPGVLPGVTRAFFLEVVGGREASCSAGELARADEVFLTSSIREVMPVVALDGRPIAQGRPGPAARRLQALLRLRSSR